MARRKNNQPERVHTGRFLLVIMAVLVVVSILKAIVEGFRSMELVGKGLVIILIMLASGIVAFFWWQARRLVEADARDRAKTNQAVYENKLQAIKLVVDEHLLTLIAQKNLRTSRDAYGNATLDGWIDEMNNFIDSTVKKRIPEVDAYRSNIINIIEQKIAAKASTTRDKLPGYVTNNGHEFEQECLDAFKAHGWTGYKTKGSGDQGADIVISKNGITVAVQCKLYANKVGNAAVQQIHAARAIYKSDYAAVITNNGYTPSAYQAAAHTDVFLIVTGAEEELDRLVFG